jgi:ADP-ribose pyrophosphatase YjhB (NUDIX family)
MSTSEGRIRVKAICVLRRGTALLLSFAIDPDTGRRYARPLGGGVEVGERAEDAVCREFREEIGAELTGVRRLGVVENVFTWQRQLHHEVIFVFAADFADRDLYARESFVVQEAVCDGPAEWVEVARVLGGDPAVYPPELVPLLDEATRAGGTPSNQA